MSTESESPGRKRRSFIEEARRAQIVDAATTVVAEAGYANASVARIAQQAGISKGVITYHFSTKDEILRTVVTRFFDRGWEHIAARIAAEPTAAGQVRGWIGGQLEFFGAHRTEFLAMSEIMANHREADGARAYGSELDEERVALTEILERGQRDGELRAFDASRVANVILRANNGVLESWAYDPTLDLATESAVLLDFIDHAILKDVP